MNDDDEYGPQPITLHNGKTVHSITLDKYYECVIVFTDGTKLKIREESQTGEMGVCND